MDDIRLIVAEIKYARVLMYIEQSELSFISGVPIETIKKMENYKCTPTLDTICKLRNAINYDFKYKV